MSAGLTPAGAGDASVGLGAGLGARSGSAGSLRAALGEAARFLVRPVFAARPLGSWRARGQVMLGAGLVHLAIGAGVLAPLWLAGRSTGILPHPASDPGSFAASPLAWLVVAPLIEELLFRGWLSGRVAALRFAACGFAAMALMLAGVALVPDHARALGLAGAALALLGLVRWSLTRERAAARAVPPAFIRHFGPIVWAQALLFGLVHLGNYAGPASPLGLAVVLPQVTGGLLLAFVRTRAGLPAAIAYHAGYNGLILAALALAARA